MNIDVIGAPFDDDESIENWQEDEIERRMRKGRDPNFDYMNRDPRNPDRYPMGSGGEVNYGIRMRETVNPAHTTGETFMGARSGGTRARLHADMTRAPNLPARLAYNYEEQDDNETLASLGFIGHSGMGGDDAVYGAESMNVMVVNPAGLGDIDGTVDYTAIGQYFAETFLSPKFDGKAPTPLVMNKLGSMGYGVRVGEIGAFGFPDPFKAVGDVGKAVGGALNAAGGAIGAAGGAIVKGLSDSYNACANALDFQKPQRDKMIAQMNQVKGRLVALESKKPKSPKNIAALKSARAEYDAAAVKAAGVAKEITTMEKGVTNMKAAGVATAVGVAAKVKYTGALPANTATNPFMPAAAQKAIADAQAKVAAQTKLNPAGTKGLTDDERIAMEYLGIEPTIVAAIVVVSVAGIIAAGVVITSVLNSAGSVKTKVDVIDKNFKTNEDSYNKPVTVPYDPKTQAYTEIIKDPVTEKVIALRTGDQLSTAKNIETVDLTKIKTTQTDQSGQAKVAFDDKGNIVGTTSGNVAAAAQSQDSLLGKMGIGAIPWYAWLGIAAGGGAVIYVLAMRGKKKKAAAAAAAPPGAA